MAKLVILPELGQFSQKRSFAVWPFVPANQFWEMASTLELEPGKNESQTTMLFGWICLVVPTLQDVLWMFDWRALKRPVSCS